MLIISAYSRIKWLHEQLHLNKLPTIKKLCETFEISYRQGQRDIEYMRDFLGAPVEYSSKDKGYIYAENFTIPTFYLSQDEAVYIQKLADYYNSLRELGLDEYKTYSDMFNRISSNHTNEADNKTRLQVPYTAKIKITSARHSYRLLDKFLRRKIDDIFIYEFHNTEIFIGLLLSCVDDFIIIFPNWLKERVLQICRRTIKNHD